MLARPGGLDGGIQCQQVGLFGYGLDGVQKSANPGRHLFKLVHQSGGFFYFGGQLADGGNVHFHLFLAGLGESGGILGLVGRTGGKTGHFFNAANQLVHRVTG